MPKRNFKVMTDEGNMGVERELDEKATEKRIDICVDSNDLKKPRQRTQSLWDRLPAGP